MNAHNIIEIALLVIILIRLANINRKVNQIMPALDDLTAQVKANTDAETSAVVLIEGLAAKLKAAGTDPAALTALHDELKTSADALGAAVVANTPVA